jgi:D-serine deaminase-like pyridoxal phosphate-dependent protein
MHVTRRVSTLRAHLFGGRQLLSSSTSAPWRDNVPVSTPAVHVCHESLMGNITRMQELANAHGVSLRPHVKTHKSLDIGALQDAHGAVGFTCSKPDEAATFLRAGYDVLLAFPVNDGRKLEALLAIVNDMQADGPTDATSSDTRTKLCVMVDSTAALAVVERAAERSAASSGGVWEAPLEVMIKIDGGMHRCGLPEDDPRLPALARAVAASPLLALRGIMTHGGHAYGAASFAECRAIADAESAMMRRVRDRLQAEAGVPCREVSVGSTLTELARTDWEGLTEIRPGNYVFNDLTPLRLELVQERELALTVLATVRGGALHYCCCT